MGGAQAENDPALVEVRRGLSVVLLCFVLITLASVATQLLNTSAVIAARDDPRVARSVMATSSLATLLYRLFYSLMTAFLAAAAGRIARAQGGGHARAFWTTAVCLALAAVVNLVLLKAGDAIALLGLYMVCRAVGIATLLWGTLQLATTFARRPAALLGLLFTFFALDLGLPFLDLTKSAWGIAHPWPLRLLTLLPQLGLTVLFGWIGLLVLRALPEPEDAKRAAPAGRARGDASEQAHADRLEPDPELESDSELEPGPDLESADAAEIATDRDREGASAQVGVVALTVLGAATLPLIDFFGDARVLEGLASRLYGHGARGDATSLAVLLIPAFALVMARSLFRAFPAEPYRARLVFVLIALAGGGYTLHSAYALPLARSTVVSQWPNCDGTAQVAANSPDGISGPRLSDGRPCIYVAERPGMMRGGSHETSVRDGIVHIVTRFPQDRLRFFGGTLLSLLALGWSGWRVFRVAE